jgi:uncharacterized cupredoxin-like copper-binding protein
MRSMTTTALGLAAMGMIAGASAWAAEKSSVAVSLSGEGDGQMAITVDHATVPAGRVTFVVKNDAVSQSHEMLVIKLPAPDAELPYDAGKERVPEGKVKKLREVSDLKPGTSKSMTLDLQPGTYRLICNVKGHYKAGMSTVLTVTS